jgi:hypothetical protein
MIAQREQDLGWKLLHYHLHPIVWARTGNSLSQSYKGKRVHSIHKEAKASHESQEEELEAVILCPTGIYSALGSLW